MAAAAPGSRAWPGLSREKREEFDRLFRKFTETYAQALEGSKHLEHYDKHRQEGHKNFQLARQARDVGEDFSDLVLTGVLPHRDTNANRDRKAWIHIGTAINKDIRDWFQSSGLTQAEGWPHVAATILDFVTRCNDHPDELPDACAAFPRLSDGDADPDPERPPSRPFPAR